MGALDGLTIVIADTNLGMLPEHFGGSLEDQVINRVLLASLRQKHLAELH